MKIPIIFLGTSQAIPTSRRNHTSILLTYKNENILIDCGEGTQRQFRKARINPCNLTRLLITHWHGDHILGIPGLLQTLALNGYNKTLHVYGPKGTKYFLEAMLKMFIFEGKLKYKVKEIEQGKILETPDFYIEAEPMEHTAKCLAYSFIEKEKIRIDKEKLKKAGIKGKLIGEIARGKDVLWNSKTIKAENLTYKQESRKITFILDTAINNKAVEIAKNSNLLVCASTYSEKEAEQAKEYLHLTASQAAEIAKKAKVKKLILTHISQRYDNKEKQLLEEARKTFKDTEIAEDLMKIEI